jgi:cobalamin biosynthesis protein CbiD
VKRYGKYRRKERISTTTTTGSAAATAASAAVAVAIALKFHSKHVTNKNKTKHIMKISQIKVNIYDKTATSQQNSDYDVE